MKLGDRFIYYGIKPNVIGRVTKISEKISYDLRNGIKVVKVFITDENGKSYDSRECLQIEGQILPSFIRKLKSLF